MKKPVNRAELSRMIPLIDKKVWGDDGPLLVEKVDDLRERMRLAAGMDLKQGQKQESSLLGDFWRAFSGVFAKSKPDEAPVLSTSAVQHKYDYSGCEDIDECRHIVANYQNLVQRAEAITFGKSLEEVGLKFTWSEAFDGTPHTVSDWTYERACAVFNLAAILSFLGTHQDRGSNDGIKAACKLYQEAAGALGEVRKLIKEAAWPLPPDLSSDTTELLHSLMLAQAQKTFVEKAERDGLSAAILGKLSAACAAMYADVSAKVAHARTHGRPIAGMAHCSSGWLEIIQMNAMLFDGMQHFYLAAVDAEAAEHGSQVGRLAHAEAVTAKLVRLASETDPALLAKFRDAHERCHMAYAAAKEDNDKAYFGKVLSPDELPTPEQKRMVQPLLPPEIAEDQSLTPLPQYVEEMNLGGPSKKK
jgi:hypothetical protein